MRVKDPAVAREESGVARSAAGGMGALASPLPKVPNNWVKATGLFSEGAGAGPGALPKTGASAGRCMGGALDPGFMNCAVCKS